MIPANLMHVSYYIYHSSVLNVPSVPSSLPRERRLNEFVEHWGTEAGHCIPATSGWESCSITAEARSDGDICEGPMGAAVDPWIEKTKRFLASSDDGVIYEANNRREGRARCRRAAYCRNVARPHNSIAIALRGYVWISPTAFVVEPVVQAV